MEDDPDAAGNSESQESRRTKLTVAKYALVGSLAGAAIGVVGTGATAYFLNKQEAQQETRRADEAEQKEAVAIARVMLEGFDSAVTKLCFIGKDGFLRTYVPLRTSVAASDLHLLASHLEPNEKWSMVFAADSELQTWDAFYRDTKFQGTHIDPTAWGLRRTIDKAEKGREALVDLAGYKGKAATCNYDTWPAAG